MASTTTTTTTTVGASGKARASHVSGVLAWLALTIACHDADAGPDDTVISAGTDEGPAMPQAPPVERHGRLAVDGLQLVDACGHPVQLRGISDQGIQWFPWRTCLDDDALTFLLASDGLDVDLLRIPVYVTEGGWLHDPEGMRDALETIADAAIARGLYVIIDWHVTSFDPNDRLDEAREFWTAVATRYAGVPNVIYEIANEPSEVAWYGIREYAGEIIPIIRAINPEVVIVVGTPDDSGELADVADAPLSGELAHNVMYTFHYYAASMELSQIEPYLARLPIFVTEWAAASYSGDSPDDYDDGAAFLAALAGEPQVSWVGWSFTDDAESSAMLRRGTCAEEPGAAAGPWDTSALSTAGWFMRRQLRDTQPRRLCASP
ncbi:MAG: glycoside hydrolase family 5 protein [Deltaproteobacteria bacterium]|nr:glycoside hydrolase family 5 protein [Deltaproteobacteria bacterium]